jgi:uncharacterized protein GlcG (DUF336 family)
MSDSFGIRQNRISLSIVALALGLSACGDDITNVNGGPATFTPQDIGVTNATLQTALDAAVAVGNAGNGGLGLPMWATVVDRHGVVVAVAHSGAGVGDQWLGSRAISAQKASTANDFSLDNLALSTANLWAPTQPGGSLFGLQESNPVDPAVVYGGSFDDYGTVNDFMVGKKPGGINVFGGGLALYDAAGNIVGAVGLSGDTSCADHNIAWRVRDGLALNFAAGLGVDAAGTDDIIYDLADDGNGHFVSAGGFGHPICGFGEETHDMETLLPLQ